MIKFEENIEIVANTVNGYKIEDIILWTIGIFLALISIIFSILSYHFANKSTQLITELMEKTWVTSETDKYFFINMKNIKHQNNKTLTLLNSEGDVTFEEYVSESAGTRIIHINNETIHFLQKTKYSFIINEYIKEKKVCDNMFFEALVSIEKVTTSSKEIISKKERENLIKYHQKIGVFTSFILKEYTAVTK